MSDYLQRFGKNASNRLEQLRINSIQGLEEFSRNPVRHTTTAVRDLVKDYFDVGAAVASGLALTQWGDNLYGDYQLHFGLGGAALSAYGDDIRKRGFRFYKRGRYDEVPSMLRNIYAGLLTIAIAYDTYPKNGNLPFIISEFNEKLMDAIALLGVYGGEYERRKTEKNLTSRTRQLSLPLENLANQK